MIIYNKASPPTVKLKLEADWLKANRSDIKIPKNFNVSIDLPPQMMSKEEFSFVKGVTETA